MPCERRVCPGCAGGPWSMEEAAMRMIACVQDEERVVDRGEEWSDEDRFWKDLQPLIFPPIAEECAQAEVDALLQQVPLMPVGAQVLDLCSGLGRHSLALARRGFKVTGVDRTTHYLVQAQQAADAEGLDVEFVKDDMRTFSRPGTYHLIVNLFTSFGYFKDREDDVVTAQAMHRNLRPGGVLVMDIQGKENVVRAYTPRDWHRLPDGSLWLQERSILDGWRRIRSTWTIVDMKGKREYSLEHNLYSAQELRELLERTGFHVAGIRGSLDGAPYDENATHLVAIAVK